MIGALVEQGVECFGSSESCTPRLAHSYSSEQIRPVENWDRIACFVAQTIGVPEVPRAATSFFSLTTAQQRSGFVRTADLSNV